MRRIILAVGIILGALTQPRSPAAEPALERTDLFEAGRGGYTLYRIPGLVVTAKGTLLAYCEARTSDKGDWGATDIVFRRSTDGGRSWSPPAKLPAVEGPIAKNPAAVKQKLGKEGEVLYNNPVAIPDRSGLVHFLFCVEYDRCFYTRSDDDGRTFAKPREVTEAFAAFRPEYLWQVLATGPGHGIQLRDGRLLVPIWLSTGTGRGAHRPSCVSTIVSDDGGATWQRGTVVCADPHPANPSEAAAVQLADGRVMLNIRHEPEPHLRAVSVSDNGQTGWSPPRYDRDLPEPVCQGTLARLSEPPDNPRTRVLFANPHNPGGRQRKNLTVKLSYDEGGTWAEAKAVEPGASGYSDLAVGPDGTIYCFFERGTGPGRTLSLAKFNLEWLTDGRDRIERK
ncbi:MAG TPA: sialidase family protein [Gemmataceae bacterium]